MIGEIRQNFTEASASVRLILATALIVQREWLATKWLWDGNSAKIIYL